MSCHKGLVEIHGSRTAEIQELPKWALFSSSHASVALRGILQKNIDEASKKNNFQKKFIKNDLFVEKIDDFQEQKCEISLQNLGNFQWKTNGN